ncbi:hypothetical protein [Chitinophaga rhizophila]|uniref:Uncharacterized protein n=1 Tax=Chitinophaga rhizophila TaxID=2866212 RepID=A0ABS7GCT9_9BACT|nr:hypothetical protein [Chitinophaga rhizophila]MBW8685236.1 hypothetical protein [Chitinophaga rhizophila]
MSPAKHFFELFLFSLVSISLLLFVLGFLSPGKSLFWLKGKKTRLKSAVIYTITFVAALLVINAWHPPTKQPAMTAAELARIHQKTDEQMAKEVFAKTGKIYTKGLIKSGTVYTYEMLPEPVRRQALAASRHTADEALAQGQAAATTAQPYYVRLVLDNKLLAKASAGGTVEESELLDGKQPGTLYGASHNSFQLYTADSTVISVNEQPRGAKLFYIRRDYNIDTLFLGPCIGKPAKVRINCARESLITDPITFTF